MDMIDDVSTWYSILKQVFETESEMAHDEDIYTVYLGHYKVVLLLQLMYLVLSLVVEYWSIYIVLL